MKFLVILFFISCRSVHVVSPIDSEVNSVIDELSPDKIPDPVFRERVRRAIVDQKTEREQIQKQLGQKLSPPNIWQFLGWAVVGVVAFIGFTIIFRVWRF